MALLEAGGGTRVQPPGWLLQSPGHPHPKGLWFSDQCWGRGGPGAGVMVLGMAVGLPREHGTVLERAGAAGGELGLLPDSKMEETGDFPSRAEQAGKERAGKSEGRSCSSAARGGHPGERGGPAAPCPVLTPDLAPSPP